ncbi:hypothetical protein H632_c17p2 [Helicosporidium sp. ATCC 50920]|nr:hypothetical protein H632_c17p2 [Helicosporidium sp. ATCC 50920]|eukprot:KDD77110.1 hypothetical protein H632_c17p2 [Helicosporidium sp. ATCC 50920]
MRWGTTAGGSGRMPTFAPPYQVVSARAPVATYPFRARARLRASQSPPPALARLAKSFQQAADPLVVWVASSVDSQGVITWMADSDSQLTKGLAAVLVQGLSGIQAAELAALPPSFIADFGFAQALTPSRSNGFLNMFLLMRRKAAEIASRLASGEVVESHEDAEADRAPVQSALPLGGDADLAASDAAEECPSPEHRRHAEAGSAPRAPHAPGREGKEGQPEAVQAAERALTKELNPQR